MPYVPPGHAAVSVPYRHDLLARSAYITFGVRDEGEPDRTAIEIANLVQAEVVANLLPLTETNVVIGPTEVQLKPATASPGGGTIPGVASSSARGTTVRESPPGQVALLVAKHSSQPGRRGRGRFYIPWSLDESSVDEVGRITAGTLTIRQTALTTFLNDLLLQDVPMVILPALQPGPAEENPAPQVTGLVADPLVGTQRRRLGR